MISHFLFLCSSCSRVGGCRHMLQLRNWMLKRFSWAHTCLGRGWLLLSSTKYAFMSWRSCFYGSRTKNIFAWLIFFIGERSSNRNEISALTMSVIHPCRKTLVMYCRKTSMFSHLFWGSVCLLPHYLCSPIPCKTLTVGGALPGNSVTLLGCAQPSCGTAWLGGEGRRLIGSAGGSAVLSSPAGTLLHERNN